MGEATAEVASDTTGNSKWQLVFEAVLHQILIDFEGPDVKVKDGMESGMRKLFQNPYLEELRTLKGVAHESGEAELPSLEEAQRVLFVPKLSDMQFYALAFRRETPEAEARRERIFKFKLMSVFYTHHRKNGTLMDSFMHYGGLESLAVLLGEDHPVIQSQCVDILMELLSPLMSLQAASSSRQEHIHHQVFLCLRSRSYWSHIARIIREPNELFPRSHAHCLRLLLGAIAWLKPSDGALPESGTLLGADETEDALSFLLQNPGNALATHPEARHWAEDVLMELKGQPVIRTDPLKGADLNKAMAEVFDPNSRAREDAAHAWQSLRQLGNDSVKAGLIWPAEAAYRLALEEGGKIVPQKEASLIESNRALVLLKAGHHLEAAAAAQAALERDPRNAKAAYRRAQALIEAPNASAEQLRSALLAATLAAKLEPKDTKVMQMFQKAEKLVDELPRDEPVEALPDNGTFFDGMD